MHASAALPHALSQGAAAAAAAAMLAWDPASASPVPGVGSQQAPGLHISFPRWLDLRAVHVEEGGRYWSPGKCTTMQHVAALAKALRRKNRHAKILHDTS